MALGVVPARFVSDKRWVLLRVCKEMGNVTIPMRVQIIQAIVALALKRVLGPRGFALH